MLIEMISFGYKMMEIVFDYDLMIIRGNVEKLCDQNNAKSSDVRVLSLYGARNTGP